jgi:SAM-dependent methyltransferase
MTPRRAAPEPEDDEGLRRLLAAVPTGGTALEMGPGTGWDADLLERHGLEVRRLDVTTDDLGGPYDAVLARAVLQHVDRAVLPAVLGRVADALKPGGAFLVSVREGEGEQWEVGASGNPCFMVLWREPDLCDALEDAGFGLEWRAFGEDAEESRWLTFLARTPRQLV